MEKTRQLRKILLLMRFDRNEWLSGECLCSNIGNSRHSIGGCFCEWGIIEDWREPGRYYVLYGCELLVLPGIPSLDLPVFPALFSVYISIRLLIVIENFLLFIFLWPATPLISVIKFRFTRNFIQFVWFNFFVFVSSYLVFPLFFHHFLYFHVSSVCLYKWLIKMNVQKF